MIRALTVAVLGSGAEARALGFALTFYPSVAALLIGVGTFCTL